MSVYEEAELKALHGRTWSKLDHIDVIDSKLVWCVSKWKVLYFLRILILLDITALMKGCSVFFPRESFIKYRSQVTNTWFSNNGLVFFTEMSILVGQCCMRQKCVVFDLVDEN